MAHLLDSALPLDDPRRHSYSDTSRCLVHLLHILKQVPWHLVDQPVLSEPIWDNSCMGRPCCSRPGNSCYNDWAHSKHRQRRGSTHVRHLNPLNRSFDPWTAVSLYLVTIDPQWSTGSGCWRQGHISHSRQRMKSQLHRCPSILWEWAIVLLHWVMILPS